MAESEKQQLSRDALLGIFACIVGIGGVVFELGWITRGVLVLFAIGLTIYAARRHSAHLVLRGLVAITVILAFAGFSARPIWEDFHLKHPTAMLPERMRGLLQPYSHPAPAPPHPKPTESSFERTTYKCKKTESADPKQIEKDKAAFDKYTGVYADTLGFLAVVSVVPGGNKAEFTPKTEEAKARLGLITKFSFETRQLGKDFLAIYTATYNSLAPYAYAAVPMVAGSEFELKIRSRIEAFAGVESGDCEMQ